MIFEIAISLGANCQSRYNISRVLYMRAKGTEDGFFVGEKRKIVLIMDHLFLIGM